MRVIGGQYRSRRLESLPGMDLRPTADRLRETLFDILTAGNPSALQGTVWLDLYAGTGAVGIEALSRGASSVYFVDSSKRATDLIRKNLGSLKDEAGGHILNETVERSLRDLAAAGTEASFVFFDPPYRLEAEYEKTLSALSGSTLLKASSVVIAEHHKNFDPGDSFGSLRRFRVLKQGDAALSFYRRDS